MSAYPKHRARLWTFTTSGGCLRVISVEVIDIDWLTGKVICRWVKADGTEETIKRFPRSCYERREDVERLVWRLRAGTEVPESEGQARLPGI